MTNGFAQRQLVTKSYQDNSLIPMTAVIDCGFRLVDQPPYSADLAASGYRLLPDMKKHLTGDQCCCDDDFVSAVDVF